LRTTALADGLDFTRRAAVEYRSTVGPRSTATALATKSLEWKSVGVSTAASLLGSTSSSTLLHWAAGISGGVEALSVRVVSIRDALTRKEYRQQILNKLTFDGTCTGGAQIGVEVLAAREEVFSGPSTGSVCDFPGGAIVAFVLRVSHGALVSLAESLAHSVNLVDRVTFASSDVVVKVAPAAVLVEVRDLVGDLAGERPERAVLDHGQKLLVDACLIGGHEGESGGGNEFHA